MVALGVELDQGFGRLAAYLVADARRPDRFAVCVELEVAVGRTAVVGAYGGVHGGLRFDPQLLAAALEGREAHSTSIDPAQIWCRKNRLQRRRVVPSDHLPGLAVDQNQVLLRTAGTGEFACYQHVLAVEGHVPHL